MDFLVGLQIVGSVALGEADLLAGLQTVGSSEVQARREMKFEQRGCVLSLLGFWCVPAAVIWEGFLPVALGAEDLRGLQTVGFSEEQTS